MGVNVCGRHDRRRTRSRLWWQTRWLVLALCTGFTGRAVVAQTPSTTPATISVSSRDIPAQRISVDLDRVPLLEALSHIAQQAGLGTAYDHVAVSDRVRVTLHVRDARVEDVFQQALAGTGLVAYIRPGGIVLIAPSGSVAQDKGLLTGIVRDEKTNAPLSGAVITVDDSGRTVHAGADGTFVISGLSKGRHKLVVRHLGYRSATSVVVVGDEPTARVTIALSAAPTMLNDVVTTATGQEARFKVGNDVGTINADSLVQHTLVRNMSDLLMSHTPGVQVTPSGGAVGAPSKIRIRGVTSSQLNNDPIVVIDGVRVNAQTTMNSVFYNGTALSPSQVNTGSPTLGGTVLAPSPLDQIDPNMIESIDVLRGPTATALYGPDASTGVIVIKTKRGQAGPWRYHVGGDEGWTIPVKRYPLNWTAWGHPPSGGPSAPGCGLITKSIVGVSQANGGCVFDSVTAFNAQNDPQLSNLATATNNTIVADASGGGSTVQGFIQADYANSLGQQKLSDIEQRRLARMWTTPVPSWMIRPNEQTNTHVTSNLQATFSPKFDIAASGQGTYQLTRNDGNGLGIGLVGLSDALGPWDTLSYLPAEAQRTRMTTSTKRGVGTANARLQAFPWAVLNGTAGLDYALRDDQMLTRAQDCTSALNASGCASSHSAQHTEVLVPSFTVGATLTYDLAHWLQAHTAFGEQYSRTQSYIVGVSATGLAFGQDLITGASGTPQANEASDEGASAGWYAEQRFDFTDRLFLTAALRRDASSSFGENVVTPTFPKYQASWVVSNEPLFPKQNVLTQLRLRAAYGESGKQGSQADVLRNYSYTTGFANGASVPVLVVSSLGNAHLLPQRDKEWETGFDASFYNDRATLGMSLYRKRSNNAIMSINLPPSPGAPVAFQTANVGDVRNTGYEFQFSIRPIDTRLLSWSFNLTASSNSNTLLRGAPLVSPIVSVQNGTGGRLVPGYPLFGLWERPILSYDDYNNDKILEPNEIVFGDSAVFVGSTDPKGSFNYANSFSMLQGHLTINSLFTQVLGLATTLSASGARGLVDPTASLAEQAAALQAFGTASQDGGINYTGASGYMGTVSYVNFAELSVSYTLPDSWAQRLRSRSVTLTAAGRNLGMWTNYRGADPTTNTSTVGGDGTSDSGTGLSQPRNWVLRVNLQL